MPARRLTCIHEFSIGRRLVQQHMTYQPVVDDDIGAPKNLEAPSGDELGIARTGADQVDRSDNLPPARWSGYVPRRARSVLSPDVLGGSRGNLYAHDLRDPLPSPVFLSCAKERQHVRVYQAVPEPLPDLKVRKPVGQRRANGACQIEESSVLISQLSLEPLADANSESRGVA